MATLKNTKINDTGFLRLPVGTDDERPSNPREGAIRFNTDTNKIEVYDGTDWISKSNE